MSLTQSRDDANTIKGSGDKEPMSSGDAAKDGFTKVAYPGQVPAQRYSDVSGVGNSVGALGQDGTSTDAYDYQPKTIDAKDPKIKD